MSGTNPVGAWALPFSTGPGVDDPTRYKSKLDANFAVAQRIADVFAPRPASPAAMSVVVDAGYTIATGPGGVQTASEIGLQTLTIATAPSAPNNRIDLIVVDSSSGVASVVTGTPAGSPSAPSVPAGKKQIAQVAVPNGITAIGNANITDLRALWSPSVPGVAWAVAAGAADAITASYAPANAALVDGLILGFRATAANATTTPSFNADGLGAKTIVKKGGQALLVGDIPGALAECLVRYNAANTRWELLNPAVALPTIANDHLLANTSGATAAPVDTALSTLIDGALGTTRGAMLERGASGWTLLAPGTSGFALCSNGSSADPSYQSVSKPGQGVSQFSNDVGYLTTIPFTTFGAIGSYSLSTTSNITGGPGPFGVGGLATFAGLPGTWMMMGQIGGGCCTPATVLIERQS
jgi:hypothetical protein